MVFFGSISHNWFIITFLKFKSIDFLVSFPKKKSSPVAWHNTPESQFFYQFFQTGFHEELTQGRKSVLSCARRAPPPSPSLRWDATRRARRGKKTGIGDRSARRLAGQGSEVGTQAPPEFAHRASRHLPCPRPHWPLRPATGGSRSLGVPSPGWRGKSWPWAGEERPSVRGR